MEGHLGVVRALQLYGFDVFDEDREASGDRNGALSRAESVCQLNERREAYDQKENDGA